MSGSVKPEALGARAAEVTIEPARSAHAAAIAELWGQLGYPTSAGEVARRLGRMDAVLHFVRVAIADGEVVGFVHAFRSDRLDEEPFAELGGVMVAADRRGAGLGRRLMRAAEAWAREAGCSLLRVRSHERRKTAHRFYEHLGYRRAKRQQVLERALESGSQGRSTSTGEDR